MATAHLIHGFLGAGKTTFATELEQQVAGVRLSIDEWYLRLYGDDRPTERLDMPSFDRVASALDDLWPQILSREVDVVLDFGFWRRASRDEARKRARRVGADARLYWVRCDDDVARRRCAERNERCEPGAFVIGEGAFDQLRTRFEPLGPDEEFELVDTTGSRR